jgi:hypothetical protein
MGRSNYKRRVGRKQEFSNDEAARVQDYIAAMRKGAVGSETGPDFGQPAFVRPNHYDLGRSVLRPKQERHLNLLVQLGGTLLQQDTADCMRARLFRLPLYVSFTPTRRFWRDETRETEEPLTLPQAQELLARYQPAADVAKALLAYTTFLPAKARRLPRIRQVLASQQLQQEAEELARLRTSMNADGDDPFRAPERLGVDLVECYYVKDHPLAPIAQGVSAALLQDARRAFRMDQVFTLGPLEIIDRHDTIECLLPKLGQNEH